MLVLSGKRPNGYFNGIRLFEKDCQIQLSFSSIFLNLHLKTTTTTTREYMKGQKYYKTINSIKCKIICRKNRGVEDGENGKRRDQIYERKTTQLFMVLLHKVTLTDSHN